jgi:glycosyltransferase involved in cell wall biosynthesis
MKVLFLLKYNRDKASSRVRGFYVADGINRMNIKSSILSGENNQKYFRFLPKLINHNAVFFQKCYTNRDLHLNKLSRFLGKKTFFDLDDAPGGTMLDPKTEKMAADMMKISSSLIVGNHRLKEFAQNYNKNVHIIHSPINLNYYKPKTSVAKREYITLGWIGNGINYKNSLKMLINPLKSLSQRYKIKLMIIGALGQKEIYENFNEMRNMKVEIVDSVEWEDPLTVTSTISKFDIGLYPLLNNEYNQYKSGYKALEYMAMGIPVVASSVGENNFIIENGREGFLVSNEKEWEEVLSRLMENENLCENMGRSGRRKVEKCYSLDIAINKLIEIFEVTI